MSIFVAIHIYLVYNVVMTTSHDNDSNNYDKGRAWAIQQDKDAIMAGIQRHGLVGFVRQSRCSWCVVTGAALGCPVKASALTQLQLALTKMDLY